VNLRYIGRNLSAVTEFFQPTRDRAKFEIVRLSYKLRLGFSVLQRVKVPRMPCAVHQMLWNILIPVPLWRTGRVVRDFAPRIRAAVDEEEIFDRNVEAAIAIPRIDVGRCRNLVVFPYLMIRKLQVSCD
jgi:hypothetical protein